MPPSAAPNQSLAQLLKRWTTAAEQAGHSSTQAQVFRRAARSVAAHPTAIASKAEALAVKFVGEALASALADHLAFERARANSTVRTVARLQHDAEGKWWCVRVCANMAWRSWGRCSGTGSQEPGMVAAAASEPSLRSTHSIRTPR
jgi:hypothetical protein